MSHDAMLDNNSENPKRILQFHGKLGYHSIALGVTCLIMAVILLVMNTVTVDDIDKRNMEDRLANLNEVLPAELYDNNPLTDTKTIEDAAFSDKPVEIYIAKKTGQITATAFQATGKGYGGLFTLMMAVDATGKVIGVRVITHKETPGLADRIEISKDNWITLFNGKSIANTSEKQWHVKKDGGEFDQFTGATITPRAVVKAVYNGVKFHSRHFLPTNPVTGG